MNKENLIFNLFIMLESILENYSEETFLVADGFDSAVIGLDQQSMRLIYSVSKCIEIFCEYMPE